MINAKEQRQQLTPSAKKLKEILEKEGYKMSDKEIKDNIEKIREVFNFIAD